MNPTTTLPSSSEQAYRLTLWVSLVIGLTIMGDSLLYSLLPLAAPRLGIALPLVGVLLSANRLIRLGSNTPVSVLFARWGPRRPFLGATWLALVAVVLYGLAPGFGLFLLARLLWGIAWSGLRQGGYQMIWTGGERQRGRLMGLQWGVIRLGSAISVLVGGVLFDRYGYRAAVAVIALFVAMGLPLAWFLSWPGEATRQVLRPLQQRRILWFHPPEGAPQRWVVVSGLAQSLLEAITVSTVALFLARHVSSGWTLAYLGTASGVLLALRWLSNLVFAPGFGWLADRVGHSRTALGLAWGISLLAAAAFFLPGVGAVVALGGIFVGNAGLVVLLSAIANSLALRTRTPHVLVGTFTTAVDAGLAVGPLLAYAVAPSFSLGGLYLAAAGITLLVVTRLALSLQRAR